MNEPLPELEWQDGVPVSTRFADPYFSPADGLAESRHVFLAGNDLPGRFRPGFVIAELGFGTGLNALASLQAWRASAIDGPLRYIAFEAFPMTAADMARALAAWPELAPLAGPLLREWEKGARRIAFDGLDLTVIPGDARVTLPPTPLAADAWFLDGFAPVRNPELWEPGLLREVAERIAPGGTLATYSAAGHVRRALADAGLVVTRAPGFGAKRHMTRAARPA